MRFTPQISAGFVLALLFAGAARWSPATPAADLRAAASEFLRLLPPALRTHTVFPFGGPERTDWHYVPRTRSGVSFAEMDDAQRLAARALFRTALSSAGLLKLEAIMALDQVLRDVEKAAGRDGAGRDPLAYYLSIFGDPAAPGAWGWKVEGHHVSLNFTIAADGAIAATPEFLGSNPAEVRRGEGAGRKVLAAEEDLARDLLGSLTDAQRAQAILGAQVPGDILSAPGRDLAVVETAGLPASSLTPDQTARLRRLIAEYTGNLRYDLAEEQSARIAAAGIENIRFAWIGSTDRGRPHYYRLTGPTFIIEYDNTQNEANHVHTVWHDRTRDFGKDLLKEHYDAAPDTHDHGRHD